MRIRNHTYYIIVLMTVLATSSGCSIVIPLTVVANKQTVAASTTSDSKSTDSESAEQSDNGVETVIFSDGSIASTIGNSIVRSDGTISTIVGGAGSHVIITNADGSISVGVNNGGVTTIINALIK